MTMTRRNFFARLIAGAVAVKVAPVVMAETALQWRTRVHNEVYGGPKQDVTRVFIADRQVDFADLQLTQSVDEVTAEFRTLAKPVLGGRVRITWGDEVVFAGYVLRYTLQRGRTGAPLFYDVNCAAHIRSARS